MTDIIKGNKQMDNETSNQPNAPATPESQTEPKYVGNTNIIDRSAQSASIPAPIKDMNDAPTAPPARLSRDSQYQEASGAFAEAIVAICGGASSVVYLLSGYFFKSSLLSAVAGGLFALVAVVFAFKQYKTNRQMTPLSVIGLSGATFTLVILLDYLVLRELIRSALGGFY